MAREDTAYQTEAFAIKLLEREKVHENGKSIQIFHFIDHYGQEFQHKIRPNRRFAYENKKENKPVTAQIKATKNEVLQQNSGHSGTHFHFH